MLRAVALTVGACVLAVSTAVAQAPPDITLFASRDYIYAADASTPSMDVTFSGEVSSDSLALVVAYGVVDGLGNEVTQGYLTATPFIGVYSYSFTVSLDATPISRLYSVWVFSVNDSTELGQEVVDILVVQPPAIIDVSASTDTIMAPDPFTPMVDVTFSGDVTTTTPAAAVSWGLVDETGELASGAIAVGSAPGVYPFSVTLALDANVVGRVYSFWVFAVNESPEIGSGVASVTVLEPPVTPAIVDVSASPSEIYAADAATPSMDVTFSGSVETTTPSVAVSWGLADETGELATGLITLDPFVGAYPFAFMLPLDATVVGKVYTLWVFAVNDAPDIASGMTSVVVVQSPADDGGDDGDDHGDRDHHGRGNHNGWDKHDHRDNGRHLGWDKHDGRHGDRDDDVRDQHDRDRDGHDVGRDKKDDGKSKKDAEDAKPEEAKKQSKAEKQAEEEASKDKGGRDSKDDDRKSDRR